MPLHLNRLRQWAYIVRHHSASVPWGRMILAMLKGPVPRSVWRIRIRTCARCVVHGRKLLRDDNGALKWVGLNICQKKLATGQTIGCGCFTPILALSAEPYEGGCWARSILGNEGWGAYHWPNTWAKVKAVVGFIFRR